MQLKVLLIKDDPERGEVLGQALRDLGHSVVGEADVTADLLVAVEQKQPNLLVIEDGAPDDDLLSRLGELARSRPIPVVLFTRDGNKAAIARAMRIGVSGYIVDGLDKHRVSAIVDVALARFEETDRLRQELESTRAILAERKAVERAKGILMKQRGFDEPQAYHALRKMAMDKNLRIGQVAENVIAVAELLN